MVLLECDNLRYTWAIHTDMTSSSCLWNFRFPRRGLCWRQNCGVWYTTYLGWLRTDGCRQLAPSQGWLLFSQGRTFYPTTLQALGASSQTLHHLHRALVSPEEGDRPRKPVLRLTKCSSSMTKRTHKAQGPQTPQSHEPGEHTYTHTPHPFSRNDLNLVRFACP